MPIDSLYQATKFSIEQGIIDLQQKFRRKNQLELQRQLNESLLQEERAYRQEKQLQELQRMYLYNSKYSNTILQKTACDPYVNSVLYDSSLNDSANLQYYELKQAIHREAEHLQYLKKLQRMRAQQLTLNHPLSSQIQRSTYEEPLINHVSPIRQLSTNKGSLQESRNYSSKKSPIKNVQGYPNNLQYDQSIEQDQTSLLQKYNKGMRAQQYNRDMERLLEIEKRLRKMQQHSANKSEYSKGNESLVTSYQLQHEENRYPPARRGRQPVPIVSAKQNIHEAQRPIRIEDDEDVNLKPQLENSSIKKVDMFQNQKIGEEINKKKQEKADQRPSFSKTQQVGLERIDKQIKSSQGKYQMHRPHQQVRPNSSRPRNLTKRQASKSNHSALSPLKSERAFSKRQLYQPYTRTNRPRTKSSKQQKNSSRNYEPSYSKQINSRMISLDPNTQKVYEQIIKQRINEKIQNRLKLLTCVFKDINMRKDRNQIDALVQRFQIESRGRKQIKTIINNDPKILKKHKMVVG